MPEAATRASSSDTPPLMDLIHGLQAQIDDLVRVVNAQQRSLENQQRALDELARHERASDPGA